MIALGICFALAGSGCYALAASLQHGAIHAGVSAGTPGGRLNLAQLWAMVRRPRWLLGLLAQVGGGVLHVIALASAPLIVVQPIGVLAIGLTVLIAVGTGRAKPDRRTILAVLASTVGVGLFVLLAANGAVNSVATPGEQSRVLLVGTPTVTAFVLYGIQSRGWARCPAFATAAGVSFGLVSVLTSAVAGTIRTQGLAEVQIYSVLGIAGAIVAGAWCVQQAYATGRPDTVVACQTVIDPLVGVLVGSCLFGEAANATGAQVLGELACATVAVVGVLVLARRQEGVPGKDVMINQQREFRVNGSADGTDRPLRIVIGADTFPPDVNGASRFGYQLATALADRAHEVHVICPSDDGATRTDTVAGVTVHRLRAHRTPFHPTFRICLPWRARRDAAALIQRLRPDVVHAQAHFMVGRAVVRGATTLSIPVVATNHFMPENLFGHLRIPSWLRRPLSRLAWRDLVRVLRNAAVVTAPTPTAVNMLHANGLPGTAVAVSCGIDLERRRVDALPNPEPTVLFVGRLDEEKRVDELLRAVPLLPEGLRERVRVDVVGDGSCRDQWEMLAQDLGIADQVRFRGFVSEAELLDAYARCSVFCMPGVAELQSIATMEAMVAGKPVVAADAVALPHLVHPGRNGWLFRPGDVTELAGKLARVLTEPGALARMGAASRKIIAGHDIEASLDEFESRYVQAMGRVPDDVAWQRATAA